MFAWLAIAYVFSATAPAGEKSIWLLQSTGWQREEMALLSALRIYTRDLRIPITITMVPARIETREAHLSDARIRCTLDASLVAWFGGDASSPELFVMRCASEEEYRFPMVPAKDRELAAQTLALKMRGLLTLAPPAESKDTEIEPAPEKKQEKKQEKTIDGLPPRKGEVVAGRAWPSRAVPGASGTPHGRREPVRGAGQAGNPQLRKQTLEGGLEWAYGSTHGFGGRRQGLLWRLAFVSTRMPLALEVDNALVTSVAKDMAWYRLIVSEIPVGVAVSARLSRQRWTFSLGPRVSVHRIQAAGFSSDGRSGSSTHFAVGLGAIERIRYSATDKVSFGLSISNEAVVPRQEFTMDGTNRLAVGRFQWTVSAGIIVHP